MLPHHHFLISVIVIIPISIIFFPLLSVIEILLWVLISGFVSILIDMDIIILINIKNDDRLNQFKNPKMIFKEFKLFMDTIDETGVLKTAMITHIIISLCFIVFFYLFINILFIPCLLGVISHIASDVPNINRVLKKSLLDNDNSKKHEQ